MRKAGTGQTARRYQKPLFLKETKQRPKKNDWGKQSSKGKITGFKGNQKLFPSTMGRPKKSDRVINLSLQWGLSNTPTIGISSSIRKKTKKRKKRERMLFLQ